MNGDLENHLKARSFRLTQRLNIILLLRTTSQGSTNLVRKFLPGVFLGHALHLGGIWKGDMLVADNEEFGEHWTRQKNHARKLNTKGVSKPKMVKNIIFPVADGTVKLSGRDHRIRESTLRRDQSVRSGDLRGDLQGSSDGSQQMDEMVDDAEVRNDFWSIEGDFIHRHHVEPRFQHCVSKEGTFLIPLKYIDDQNYTHKPG